MLDATGFDLAQALTKLFEKLQKWGDGLVLMLPNLALALLLAVATLALSGWVPRLVERLLLRASANEALTRMLASLSRVGVLVMGALWTLDLLNLEKTVTSMLAGVGVVGLALGFAFQDIAANFMSGFMMTLNRPFEVGDLVELAGRQCRVVRVQLRATEVETLDGLGILIPNKDVFQNAIVNYTRTPQRRMDLRMGTAYADDMETVRRVVLQAVAGIPHRDPTRDAQVFFEGFGDSSIDFQVRVWLTQSNQQAFLEAMIAIKRAFDAEGITIPFPIRTLDFGAKVVGGSSLDQLELSAVRVAQPR